MNPSCGCLTAPSPLWFNSQRESGQSGRHGNPMHDQPNPNARRSRDSRFPCKQWGTRKNLLVGGDFYQSESAAHSVRLNRTNWRRSPGRVPDNARFQRGVMCGCLRCASKFGGRQHSYRLPNYKAAQRIRAGPEGRCGGVRLMFRWTSAGDSWNAGYGLSLAGSLAAGPRTSHHRSGTLGLTGAASK